jgi:hypothetical protein
MTTPTDPIREALAELVALKKLKTQFEDIDQPRSTDNFREYRRLKADYERRKPLAWSAAERAIALQPAEQPFQARVDPWLMACFGEAIARDQQERSHRFIEEALELVQACGCTASEAHQLVDYVFGRPAGEKAQEVGGVMVTLAALCLAHGVDMHAAGETELARIWTKVEAIRAKQAAKPKHSPLPAAPTAPPAQQQEDARDAARYCKEGESLVQCIERHRAEHDALLRLLAKERQRIVDARREDAARHEPNGLDSQEQPGEKGSDS